MFKMNEVVYIQFLTEGILYSYKMQKYPIPIENVFNKNKRKLFL